jgi:hypothetical protein
MWRDDKRSNVCGDAEAERLISTFHVACKHTLQPPSGEDSQFEVYIER